MKRFLVLAALSLLFMSCKGSPFSEINPGDYDFSEVLTYGTPFRLGIIGEDFTRLQMHYTSVTKIDAEHYAVKGFSKVGDNVQPFEGTIQITSLEQEFPEEGEEETDSSDHEDGHDVYMLVCQYNYQQADGSFEGKSYNEVYFKEGKVYTDECYLVADGYDNNWHKGTFTSNTGLRNGQETVANWGVFRIPDSDDLDQGVGEFVPSEKYRDNGWASYFNSRFNYEEGEQQQLVRLNAIFEESRQWWDPEAPKLTAEIHGLMDNPMKKFDGPQHFFIEATTPAGTHTYLCPSLELPEYQDINFDGYRDIYQSGDEERHDDGVCYLYNPQTKEFDLCPSFHEILYKANIALFPQEKAIMTSHNFHEKGEFFYYLYRFEDGKFVLCGTVLQKDGIYTEYDKDGNQIHQSNNIADLSRVWAVCFAN